MRNPRDERRRNRGRENNILDIQYLPNLSCSSPQSESCTEQKWDEIGVGGHVTEKKERLFGLPSEDVGEHIVFHIAAEPTFSGSDADVRSDPSGDASCDSRGVESANDEQVRSRSDTTISRVGVRPLRRPRQRSVDSFRLERMQMLSDFLEMHFPTAEAKANLAYRKSYLAGLPEIDLSSTPMLRNAVEAICFAHAGSHYNDQRLIQRSQVAYGRLLNALLRSVGQSKVNNEPRIIIPSIMLLTLYDDAIPTCVEGPNGWRAHYCGLHDYLKAAGPSVFNMSEPFEKLVFMNIRVPTLFLGNARRKAIILNEPRWLALSNQTNATAASLAALHRRLVLLPALLEKSDLLLQKKPLDYSPGQLVRDIAHLRTELEAWSVNESSFSDQTARNHELVNVSDITCFDMTVEEHIVLSTNPTFSTYFGFNSYRIAEDMTLYWMFCLILDCTLLRIMHFQRVMEVYQKPRTSQKTQRDAHIRAQYLCRSVFYLSKFNSQGIAGYTDSLVALAEGFFSEVGAIKELGWCQAVRCATKLRVERLRRSRPRTLCRMGDLADDLATATKFKSRPSKPDT